MAPALEFDTRPIDYWPAVARRGVMALGFSVQRSSAGPALIAELSGPLDGWARRAALAAITIHKDVEAIQDIPTVAARAVLTMALELSPAIAALAAYQELLLDRLWAAIAEDPPRRLEALAAAQGSGTLEISEGEGAA